MLRVRLKWRPHIIKHEIVIVYIMWKKTHIIFNGLNNGLKLILHSCLVRQSIGKQKKLNAMDSSPFFMHHCKLLYACKIVQSNSIYDRMRIIFRLITIHSSLCKKKFNCRFFSCLYTCAGYIFLLVILISEAITLK